MDLKKIANNLMNNIPKVSLKRIDLTNNTSSSIESSNEGNQRFFTYLIYLYHFFFKNI